MWRISDFGKSFGGSKTARLDGNLPSMITNQLGYESHYNRTSMRSTLSRMVREIVFFMGVFLVGRLIAGMQFLYQGRLLIGR